MLIILRTSQSLPRTENLTITISNFAMDCTGQNFSTVTVCPKQKNTHKKERKKKKKNKKNLKKKGIKKNITVLLHVQSNLKAF